MKYSVHITEDKEAVEKLLAEPHSEDEWLGSGTLLCRTAVFDDGYSMDVKICGVDRYEEDGCNSAWTEAILFTPHGRQVLCTEVCEDFFGDWQLEFDGNEYNVIVEEG